MSLDKMILKNIWKRKQKINDKICLKKKTRWKKLFYKIHIKLY